MVIKSVYTGLYDFYLNKMEESKSIAWFYALSAIGYFISLLAIAAVKYLRYDLSISGWQYGAALFTPYIIHMAVMWPQKSKILLSAEELNKRWWWWFLLLIVFSHLVLLAVFFGYLN